MSDKQKQLNLKHLNYNVGVIDGVFGSRSKKATKEFQKDYGLTQDSVFGLKTMEKSKEVWKKIQTKIGVVADGIVGNATISAIKDYQYKHKLTPDGIVGKKTLAKLNSYTWEDFPDFKREEFKCQCNKYCNGYPTEMDFNLIAILQDIRIHYNKPIVITSGLRCKQHNKNVGGTSTSRHLKGKAVDFAVKGVNHWVVSKYLKTRKDIRYTYTNDKNMYGVNHIDIK